MIGALFVIVAVLVVGAVIWLMWPEDDRKQWRVLKAEVGTPWVLMRKVSHFHPFGVSSIWTEVGRFETKQQALSYMRLAITRENPSVVAEFDGMGREVA